MIIKCNDNRMIGLDIVRFIAVFFVISVHFFLNNGFYQFPITGKRMFIMLNMRWLFYCCVPLFMILTGYLQNKKKLNKYNYKSIYSVISSYLFISIFTIFFRCFYLKQQLSVGDVIISILNFTAAPYSWYVEMYIGLFLLIPFLNIIYNGIESQKKKLFLIFIMIFLTSIPSITNVFKVDNTNHIKILSDYWIELYPFTYYFIGAYLFEFKIKIKKTTNLLLIFAIVFIESICTFFNYYGKVFAADFLEGYNSLPTLVISVLIFILLYDLDIKSNKIKFLISDFSKTSLDIYLVSYVFDSILYPYIKSKISFIPEMLPYYFIIVPSVFLSSYIFALIERFIFISIKNKKISLYYFNNVSEP